MRDTQCILLQLPCHQLRQQARVPATVAQAFERDEGVSDGEGDGVTLLSSAAQLPPSRLADAETLSAMLQHQLHAINEQIRWVCLNSAAPETGLLRGAVFS
ncbi:Liprin-alpha-1 [Parelaphostrongylus tenuis]|uniref:Liprin-alpha-1 n=1 Tax=Parelaphostrongylus tenuis TaxID=148309 RepID=A0AAD5WEM8_PARTN|nr:Liprin-alpha-1 [Parelaphostrongylus tenuis]